MGKAKGGGGAHLLMCWAWALSGVGLASGSPRAAAFFFCPLKGCDHHVLYVLSLHVSTATATGPAAPTKGFRAFKERLAQR